MSGWSDHLPTCFARCARPDGSRRSDYTAFIAGNLSSVLLDRPYPGAPVSPLYYDGRREELAFEKPVGNSADKRHHIRLWMVLKDGEENRPVWLGAVTFDRGVGFSHYTGAVTHHIAPDIDAERQLIEANLQSAGMIEARYTVAGVGPTLRGRNGEGDLYYTDGEGGCCAWWKVASSAVIRLLSCRVPRLTSLRTRSGKHRRSLSALAAMTLCMSCD
jgi:hypothetical protein